jgi:SWI/SNF-related matrix-associated actin-dependent regulator 1 of chromatin subfamily A
VSAAADTANRIELLQRRVLLVQPRPDARSFAVTIGPGPDVYWYTTAEPPRLGAIVDVTAQIVARQQLNRGGSITVITDVSLRVLGTPYSTRVVDPLWVERVKAAVLRPMYGYQETGAAWMAARLAGNRGAVLADEPGVGKTIQTVAAVTATGAFPCIVVCPKSIKRNWAREWALSAAQPTVEILSGRAGRAPIGDVVIVNYELMASRERQLAYMDARSIVFDEAHQLKAHNPGPFHRAAVATRLAHWVRRPLVTTGTPVQNRPEELWRLLHLVDPEEWPDFETFAQRYCRVQDDDELVGRRIVTRFGRAENLDELHARVQLLMLRRLRHEVLHDLPSKSRRSILVQLDPKHHTTKEYRAAEADIIAWMRAHGQQVAGAMRTQALIKLTKLRRLAAMAKMHQVAPEYLGQWFDEVRDPLVIFAYHVDVQHALSELSLSMGLRVQSIHSKQDDQQRERAVDSFNAGEADVFVAPIDSAGVGLNLQARCANVLFIERVWSPYKLVQAEDRCHRIGQLRPVTVTYLDAADTVDEHLAEVLDAKLVLIKRVVDDQDADGDGFAVESALIAKLQGG